MTKPEYHNTFMFILHKSIKWQPLKSILRCFHFLETSNARKIANIRRNNFAVLLNNLTYRFFPEATEGSTINDDP